MCISVIGMLNDGDISFHNLLGYIIRHKIVFNRKEFRLCTYFVNCGIKQISLGRSEFSDSPIAVANIFLSGKLTVFIGNILIYKSFAFVDTVDCTRKFCVALWSTFFSVALGYGSAELFKNICKVTGSYFFPVNRCCLICRNYISDSCIHFFDCIRF